MRLVLLLAISVFVGSIIDFGINAYQKTSLFTSSLGSRSDPKYADDMQLDAAVALLAAAVVLGISVELSELSRRGKRLVFGAEAVVLTLIVVAILVRDQLATFG